MIELNKKINNFTFQATSDLADSIYSFKGKNIVLYFYPKDNTPGCTTQGIEFSEIYNKFTNLNIVIFGVSKDSIASHERFKSKYNFPFDLICDHDESICNIFNVIKPKKIFGKNVVGIERSTFFIDSNLVLRKEWRKVKAKEHAENVLNTVSKMV